MSERDTEPKQSCPPAILLHASYHTGAGEDILSSIVEHHGGEVRDYEEGPMQLEVGSGQLEDLTYFHFAAHLKRGVAFLTASPHHELTLIALGCQRFARQVDLREFCEAAGEILSQS